jgi:O-antigen/teichoic acid export membrane protein
VSDGSAGPSAESGFAQAAIRGSLWTAMQATVNKLAAAGATFALGYLLQPADFGAAWFAVSAALLVSCFHVMSVGDVLLAYPNYVGRLASPAQRIAFRVAAAQGVVILAAGVFLAHRYPDRQWLLGLMAVAAVRPLSDALVAVPLAQLRRDLKFRRISIIDGTSALVASLSSVALAWLGAGPFAIVVPPIALMFLRGVLYRGSTDGMPPAARPYRGIRALVGRSLLSGFGSYLAGVLFLLETMILGLFVSERPLGLFAFAFGLASQVNSIVSFQVAGALQPIFGHIEGDSRRQIEGLVRSCRLVAAVLVPALLVQAAVGGEFIRIAWAGKWDDAVLVFQVLSVGQALYVCQWPAAFVLKSQGRFRAYLKMQLLNIGVAGTAFALSIRHGVGLVGSVSRWLGGDLAADSLAPVAVASCAVAILALFGPLTLWVAGRPSKLGLMTALDVLWRPWIVALPVATAAGFLSARLATASGGGRSEQLIVLVGIAGLFAVMGTLGALQLADSTRRDSLAIARVMRGRLVGTPGRA